MIDTSASLYKILIVDDVPTNVMLVHTILKREGYSLMTADNGLQALRLVKERCPNLILLDIMMPEMDGYEVLRRLKSDPETQNIPVIIMSALNDMNSIIKGYQLGAAEYVTKPFQREELVKRVGYRFEMFNIKRIKKELEDTIKSRDALYSVIAHDLRSPLGTLKMMNAAVLNMIDKKEVSAEAYEMLNLMNKTSDEVFQLLDNLLKWAKNRLNKDSIQYKTSNINNLIDETVKTLHSLATFKNINLSTELPDETFEINTDPEMVGTVIRNLITNAIKFSNQDGHIDISLFKDNGHIVVKVKDDGVGIKNDDLSKVLNPEMQFSTYGTNNEKGAGLGLNLCNDFAEMLGGRLWFDSEENKGTTFYFSFAPN